MKPWIRAAAKAIRDERGRKPASVAVERDVAEATVRRFEGGKSVNIDTDAMIAAYSRDTDVPVIEFWRRAVEMWQAELDGTTKS